MFNAFFVYLYILLNYTFMKNKIKFSVYPKPIGKGMLSILIKAVQHGRSVNIDTSVNIFKDEWNDTDGVVINNPNSKSLNKYIRQTIYDLETIEFDADMKLSLSRLKKSYENKAVTNDFYAFIEKNIPLRDVKDGTKRLHYDWLKKIKRFKTECRICELTEEWVHDFYRWGINRGDSESTVIKNMQTLKIYWNLAKKTYGNKVADDIFDWYHPKTSYAFKSKGLDDDDVRLIENFIFSPSAKPTHRKVMEQFLFMCYTGCRFSDFNSLSLENFKYDNGKLWLSYTSVKTNTPVHIPLFALFDGRAEQLFCRHRDDFADFFHIGCNGHYNQQIQKICRDLGITKRVTAHVARHTCACRLINKDVPVTTIQKVIGHRQIRITMQYAHTNDNALVRQLTR